jgi:hypothetical protein
LNDWSGQVAVNSGIPCAKDGQDTTAPFTDDVLLGAGVYRGKTPGLGKKPDCGWLPLHPLEHAPEEHPPTAGAPPRIAQEEMNIVERIATNSVITCALLKFSPFFDAGRLKSDLVAAQYLPLSLILALKRTSSMPRQFAI